MSYRWEPIFVCELCGKAEPAERWQDIPFGLKWLPYGWSGSSRKRGECYCEECTEAIRRIKGETNK